NKRTDEYGGSLENRGRFLREVIYAIKEVIGDDHPLIVRMNGNELLDRYGGNTEEECLELMKMAAKCGVDMISIVVGWQESPESSLARDIPPGHWNYLALRAKREIPDIPIAFGVRLPDAVMANSCIEKGEFDFWEVCRPFLADPQRLHKTAEGRFDEIKPCIGCLLCLSRMFRDLPYLCTINPILGHEVEPEYHIRPASYKKNVIIIGGGPAGMECAIAAAQRGHKVTVFEKSDHLGGQLFTYAKNDLANKKDLEDLISYYNAMAKKLNIEVNYNTEVTGKMYQKKLLHSFDTCVVATGSGIDTSGINGSEKAFIAHDVMENKVKCGDKVAVIGGGKIGLCTAEHLAKNGHEVVIIESTKRVAGDVIPTWKWRHTSWLEELKIRVVNLAKVKEITGRGVVVVREGKESLVEADTVVLADKRKSKAELIKDLEFMVDELFFIGDASNPRGLQQAIHDGYKLGVRI
ncbi:MAG: FAD-dependent oxidoreductase, partial [Firmicutes bacterium]|nr:FAD-dependent oxidoreductase [Bacillota bacterium]